MPEITSRSPRTLSFSERNDVVRIRCRDAVSDIGHGDVEAGIDRFVDHALWVAEQADLRVWKAPDRHRQKYQAAYSLRTLLGFNADKAQDGWRDPKNNHHWVLDVWEAALDDWYRINPVRPKYLVLVEAAEEPSAGPQPVEAVLSTRILDAYVRRDDGAMLTALAELEALGY